MSYKNPLIPSKKKTRTYNMTAEQLEKLVEDARKQGRAEAVPIVNVIYTAASLTSETDTWGHGRIRLKRSFDKTQKLFEEVMEGRISYVDLLQALYDEHGIRIDIEYDGKVTDAIDMFIQADKPKSRLIMRAEKRRKK